MAFVLTEIHAFVAVDDNGEEGIIGCTMDGVFMPFVCGDVARVKSLAKMAIKIADSEGKDLVLKKFSKMEVLDIEDFL